MITCLLSLLPGRSIEKVDIRPFINNLPYGRDTSKFSTQDASGSTSQAANIVEGLETGVQCLLIDEVTLRVSFSVNYILLGTFVTV